MKKVEETPDRQALAPDQLPEDELIEASPETLEEAEPVYRPKFASEVGGRRSNRLTKFFDRTGGLFGSGQKKGQDAGVINEDGTPVLPLPPAKKQSLGRGGWTAVAILLVTLPLLGFTLWWAIDLNTQAQGYKFNLEKIQKGALSNDRDGQFVSILSSSKLQIYDLQSTDARPIGTVKLYAADYKQWAFTYGGLVPTDQNNVYMIWVVKLPANGSQPTKDDYAYLTTIVNQATGGGAYSIVSEGAFPPNFAYAGYNRLIITEEPAAKGKLDQPTGPVRFALDLSKVKLF